MPRRKGLSRTAFQIASAGQQRPKSIKRDYNQQIHNARGWATAAAGLLTGNENAGSDAYQHAVDQQRSIDSAAQDALHQLGPQFAGAAVAQQGVSGSGLTSLLSAQGAAGAYGAAQPGIARARGDLAAQGLQQGMLDALQQRRDSIASAYPAIYEQLRSTRFNENMQRQSFAESKRQFGISTQLQRDSQAQQQAQFDQSQAQQWREFLLSQADKAGSAGKGAGGKTWTSLTPGQRQSQLSDIADSIDSARNGVPNPNYGRKDPVTGQVDKRRWKPGLAPNQKKIVTVYDDLRRHGYSQFAVLQTIQRSYPPADFVGFLSRRLPVIYRRLYADTTPKGYPH